MLRNDSLCLRLSTQEKRQIAAAAEQAGVTITQYARTAITDRAAIETVSERLMVTIVAAIAEHTDSVRHDIEAVSDRLNGTVTRADLRKLSEWLATRLSLKQEGTP